MTLCQRLTKRTVDSVIKTDDRQTMWDSDLPGFGLRVSASGSKSYIVRYRTAGGRAGTFRQITIGRHGPLTPEEARTKAKKILGQVSNGTDPAGALVAERKALTIAEVARLFIDERIRGRCKPATLSLYQSLLDRQILPEYGNCRIGTITVADCARLHTKLRTTPYLANRTLALIASVFAFARARQLVDDKCNPTWGVAKYKEQHRERYLTPDELRRLGQALREAETVGILWEPNPAGKTKHAPKPENRRVIIDRFAAAAIRLLLFTGARLREILHLEWSQVDLPRGYLHLPDSKTGKKTIVLNSAAVEILESLPRLGRFVIASSSAGAIVEKPRADLQRPWKLVCRRAGLINGGSKVRIHDLRHTHASVGAAEGLGLPIIGKLLGHNQPRTTHRYAHLDLNPLRRASDQIGSIILAAMNAASDR